MVSQPNEIDGTSELVTILLILSEDLTEVPQYRFISFLNNNISMNRIEILPNYGMMNDGIISWSKRS